MFKFLKKKTDEVVRTNDRIVNRDFPWLWAIRSCWHLAFVRIVIANRDANDALEKLLAEPLSKRKNIEIWIRAADQRREDYSEVIKIDLHHDPDVSLAELVLGRLTVGKTITHMVTIISHSYETSLMVNGNRATLTMRVYRSAKGEPFLNKWLVDLMTRWKERVPF